MKQVYVAKGSEVLALRRRVRDLEKSMAELEDRVADLELSQDGKVEDGT